MVRPPDGAAGGTNGTTGGAGGRHGIPWRVAGAALVALCAVAGLLMVRAAVATGPAPPPPQPAAAAAPTAGPRALPLSRPAPGLPRSAPTRIAIPKIKVDARIRPLGVNPDGTAEVPPLEQAQDAGWYRLGASPGEIGNAVIVGHVDSRYIGPAVFYRLGALRPGDPIVLTRQDGTTVRFRVDGVQSYPKARFPTELVYGPSDRAGLRVVTCGGKFDERQRSYLDNVIVFATLVASTAAATPPATPPTAATPPATGGKTPAPTAKTPAPATRATTPPKAPGPGAKTPGPLS